MKSDLLCTALAALLFGTAAAAEPTPAPGGTKLVLLGTGNPTPNPARSGPATAVVVNDAVYLVDSGPGIVRRAAEAKLSVLELKRVFLTHLHSDHTIGLPDLIFTPWVHGRTEPLDAYGPRGTKQMMEHLSAAYQEDVDMRLHGGEPANATGWKVVPHEIAPGIVYKDGNITVKAFAVAHGSWKHAFGYRFETADRVIVISGDTTFTPAMIEHARGADVLVHEAYCEAGLAKREPARQNYHAAFHTSTSDLARIATEAKPKLLVLHHLVLSGESAEQALKEVSLGYSGKVVIGNDLDVF